MQISAVPAAVMRERSQEAELSVSAATRSCNAHECWEVKDRSEKKMETQGQSPEPSWVVVLRGKYIYIYIYIYL